MLAGRRVGRTGVSHLWLQNSGQKWRVLPINYQPFVTRISKREGAPSRARRGRRAAAAGRPGASPTARARFRPLGLLARLRPLSSRARFRLHRVWDQPHQTGMTPRNRRRGPGTSPYRRGSALSECASHRQPLSRATRVSHSPAPLRSGTQSCRRAVGAASTEARGARDASRSQSCAGARSRETQRGWGRLPPMPVR